MSSTIWKINGVLLLWDLKFEAEESPWIQFFLSLYSNVLEFQILKKITVQVLLWSIFSLLYCGCHSISMRMEMGKMLVYQTKPFPHCPTPDTPVSAGILLFSECLSYLQRFYHQLSVALAQRLLVSNPWLFCHPAVWKETDFDFSSNKMSKEIHWNWYGGCVSDPKL